MSDNEGVVCFHKIWSQHGEECGVEVEDADVHFTGGRRHVELR